MTIRILEIDLFKQYYPSIRISRLNGDNLYESPTKSSLDRIERLIHDSVALSTINFQEQYIAYSFPKERNGVK